MGSGVDRPMMRSTEYFMGFIELQAFLCSAAAIWKERNAIGATSEPVESSEKTTSAQPITPLQ